jgi:hypothetical protein
MAEVTNEHVEATGSQTTTSTVVGNDNRVRLTHTPGDNERWWYFWQSAIGSATSSDGLVRFRNETAGADWNTLNIEAQDTTNRHSICGGKEHTYGAAPGSQDIDIDFWSEAAATITMEAARIWAKKATDDDKHAAADTAATNATELWQTAATLSETLSGNYAVFCFCEFNGASGSTAWPGIRAVHGGVNYGEMQITPQDVAAWRSWGTCFVLEGLSGAQTITIDFQNSNAGAGTVSVRNCRIFALNLDQFAAYDYVRDAARTTNLTATPADKSSLTFAPAAARNHIAFGGAIYDMNNTAANALVQFERDGAELMAAQEEPNNGTPADEMPFFAFARESLTTGDKVYKTQFWSEFDGDEFLHSGAAESFILVIDLEEAGGGEEGGEGGVTPEPEALTYGLPGRRSDYERQVRAHWERIESAERQEQARKERVAELQRQQAEVDAKAARASRSSAVAKRRAKLAREIEALQAEQQRAAAEVAEIRALIAALEAEIMQMVSDAQALIDRRRRMMLVLTAAA